MKITKLIVHIGAYCVDCEKDWGDPKTAIRNSRNHAKNTGHQVKVQTTNSITYNPRK